MSLLVVYAPLSCGLVSLAKTKMFAPIFLGKYCMIDSLKPKTNALILKKVEVEKDEKRVKFFKYMRCIPFDFKPIPQNCKFGY